MDIEGTLHPWDEAHLVMVYDHFNVLLDSIARILLRIFAAMFISNLNLPMYLSPVILPLCNSVFFSKSRSLFLSCKQIHFCKLLLNRGCLKMALFYFKLNNLKTQLANFYAFLEFSKKQDGHGNLPCMCN